MHIRQRAVGTAVVCMRPHASEGATILRVVTYVRVRVRTSERVSVQGVITYMLPYMQTV